jgi:hypothetical protein
MKWLKKHQVGLTFAVLIAVVGAAFVVLAIGMKSTCEPKQPATWHIEGYENPARNKKSPKESKYVATQKEDTNAHKYDSNDSYGQVLEVWFCDEAKVTDLALVFLTYCLVVVGGIAMWALDRTSKRTERAYIVCGGPFGKPKRPIEDYHRGFHKASDFTEPWRMALHNFGKTPAYITDVTWGISPYAAFWETVKVEDVIARRASLLPQDAEFGQSNTDEAIAPDIAGIPYRHVTFPKDRIAYINWVFYGRVRYKDVFGDDHSSYFKLRLTEEHSDPLPGCHSDND